MSTRFIGVAGSVESCQRIEQLAGSPGIAVIRWDSLVSQDMARTYAMDERWLNRPNELRSELSLSHAADTDLNVWLARSSENLIDDLSVYCAPRTPALMLALWAEFKVDTEGEDYWVKRASASADGCDVAVLTRMNSGVEIDTLAALGGRLVMSVDYEPPAHCSNADFTGDTQSIIDDSVTVDTLTRWASDLHGKEVVNEQGSSSSTHLFGQ